MVGRYPPAMSTAIPSESAYVFRLVALLAVFVGGSAAAQLLAFPVPPALVGLAAVALALRVGVMFLGLDEAPGVTPGERSTEVSSAPSLRVANG